MTSRERFLAEQGAWTTSSDEESFTLEKVFPVKQDAIDYGKAEGHLFIGNVDRPNPADYIDAREILQDIVCDDEPFLGEWFEGYLHDEVNDDQAIDLKKAFVKAMENWLTLYDLWPKQANISNVESIENAVAE